ncbi:MAG: hypothetical protein HOY69_31195 [Streptomyces sp.]|nr:hypothetical protein [Streptomyces sp.]
MSAESPGSSAFTRGRVAFRHWRWERPFWAGLLTIVGGIPIGYLPYHNMTFGQLGVRVGTTAGASALIIGVLLVVLGLTMWFQSAVRVFAGVASILLGLVSIPMTNLGAIVGFMFAIVGGSMAVAWAPGSPVPDEPGEKAELPDGDPADPEAPSVPAPARPADPFTVPEPVHAGAAPDEETIEENGRHRAG